MSRRVPRAVLALLLLVSWLLAPPFALAQEIGARAAEEREIEPIRGAYDYGRYPDVLARARERIDRGGVSREMLVELHKYAGLAAFNLDLMEDAQRHFIALLRLNPDYALDPFAVPPPAIAVFERIRTDLGPQLDIIRQQLRVDADRQRRESEDRDRRRREEEERRRRLEEMSRRVTIRTVQKRSFLVNFVPFGAGQFQQDRTTAGLVLASAEGALALTSIIAYLAYNSILEERTVVVEGIGGPTEIRQYGIPPERVNEANAWRLVKYASALSFYTLYGYGVVDAIYHHEDETTSESRVQLPQDPPRAAPPVREGPPPETPPAAPPPDPPSPGRRENEPVVPVAPPRLGSKSSFHIFPTPGGLGAGFTLQF